MTRTFHGFFANVVAVVLSVCAIQPSFAQSCPDPVAADFRVVTLANNATQDLFGSGSESGNWYGVVAMDVAPDGKVFIAKMCSGDIMVYTPTESNPAATVRAGTVPTKCNNEDGLLGVAVDPSYPTTGWIYAFHTDAASVDFSNVSARNTDARLHTLTRYTYVHGNAVGSRLTNPKVILQFPRIVDDRAYHAAGGLDITPQGVMVIGTGDDTNPHNSSSHCQQNNGFGPTWYPDPGCDGQRASGNTNDLRGKLLRIKPIPFADNQTPAPGIGSTYEIPAGNLWEVINQPAFNPNWNPAVDSVSKVRKEVYSMGHRNPYHPRIDQNSGWIFTGEVGPDARSNSTTRGPLGSEEWNLATAPGFFGHPYCHAANIPWNALTGVNGNSGIYGDPYNCAAVQNTSPNNTGIRNLPPAKPSHLRYRGNEGDASRIGHTSGNYSAIGGPMYRYDTALVSAVKFPPQYEGKIFFFDWGNTNKASFRIIHVKPDATIDNGSAGVSPFPGATLAGLPNGNYIDMRFGPHDGAMYLLKNSNGAYQNFNQASLYRIEYTGMVNNACYTPFVATVGPGPVSIAREAIRRTMAPSIAVINGMVTLPVGYRTVTLYDLTGRKVWGHTRPKADRAEVVRINSGIANGILQARLTP